MTNANCSAERGGLFRGAHRLPMPMYRIASKRHNSMLRAAVDAVWN